MDQVDATQAPSSPVSDTTELSAAASLEQNDSTVSERSVSPLRRPVRDRRPPAWMNDQVYQFGHRVVYRSRAQTEEHDASDEIFV